ncbi:Myb-like DNA-binding domain [Musa troglodytarum]|uniref:Myb-like DNA-binding domain n=1 Tax=Musa troglodytarum TaxID=320322 RepID=A0A9E7IAS5_9LILI|nr:Myb-like DNA-binding domain [Musa troglodytarum]
MWLSCKQVMHPENGYGIALTWLGLLVDGAAEQALRAGARRVRQGHPGSLAECGTSWGRKTVDEVKRHYELLVEDLKFIESNRVPCPYYKSSGSRAGGADEEQR